MPAPRPPAALRISTIHLYRHLLREATYLPPPARPYIFGRIREQFHRHRRYRPPPPPPPADAHHHNSKNPARRPQPGPTTPRHLRQARHALRHLRAANAGDLRRMRHVLQLVFGAVGPRRRELVAELVAPSSAPPAHAAAAREEEVGQLRRAAAHQVLQAALEAVAGRTTGSEPPPLGTQPSPDGSSTSFESRAASQAHGIFKGETTPGKTESSAAQSPRPAKKTALDPTSSGVELPQPPSSGPPPPTSSPKDLHVVDWLDTWNHAKIQALARSQATQGFEDVPRTVKSPRQADPARFVPAINIWGKPLHARLARNKLKRGWKALIARVQPPVPAAQWDLLRDLATGQVAGTKAWAVPARRPTARSGGEARGDAPWKWREYATRRVQIVDRDKAARNRALSGEVDDTSPVPRPALGLGRLTTRRWRRMYTDIWSKMAKMDEVAPTPGAQRQAPAWKVTWGQTKFVPPPASARQLAFLADAPGLAEGGPAKSGTRTGG
ncbi:hypothetical protein P8C59_004487 [Phyllachora maydis]|uniref:LYR motif-containing protein Cup1-like N-terminal domain-containing protein n=1 Tax=Phyllachora maydis TaxID=1825666 RepID=A0AAD9MBC1_9PEZI|nr:hypothetical protein P8C59_004487 [Phyllachora maydis]